MSEKIEVQTVFGTLIAEQSGNPDYPGIHVCIRTEDGERQLALVESTPNMPNEGAHSLRILVWNSDHDDYTDDFTLFKEWPEEGDSQCPN